MEYVCQICMDLFDDKINGTECGDGHFLCDECLNPYLTQNIFPNLYALKRNKCAVNCPATNCSCTYSSIQLFGKMKEHEKARYNAIVCSLSDSNPLLNKLKAVFQDVLTLKCPCCRTPVDPQPDACSAIMCLNCGNWYCNYCFLGFSTGDQAADRGAAHTHAALHHTRPENRDAFLPPELVAAGQLELQSRLLVKCVSLAMTSVDVGGNGSSDAGLGLILIAADLSALNLNVVDIWDAAEAVVTGAEGGRMPTPPDATCAETPLAVCDGAKQLVGALVTQNWQACRQIMHAYKDNLNCDYMDEASGHHLMSLALLLRQKAIVVQLLRRGANPMLLGSKVPRTVLYIAIEMGMLDVVKLMLELNPMIDINSCITGEVNGYNLLHTAARYNHGHIVKFLVSKGADIHLKELELGYTPIHLAVVMKHSWAARELIILGSRLDEPGSAGRTSLYILAEKGQVDLLQLALSGWSDEDTESKRGRRGSVALIDINAPICCISQMRLLHVAAFHRQPQVVAHLLALGPRLDLHCRDQYGYTPLGCAVLSRNIACCLLLLNAGADASLPCATGRTPLFSAFEYVPEVVKDFITIGGVDVNTPTTIEPIESLPLTLAVIHKHHHLITTLIDLGADVNAVEITSSTALYQAVLLEENYSAKKLLERGACPSQPAAHGRTPMYAAIEKGSTALIRLLVEEYGVDVNAIVTGDESGRGALHVAAFLDNANATYELLLLGADILKVDSAGRNALDIAKERPTSPVLHILLEHQSTMSIC